MDSPLICPECRTPNRQAANFCRRCGQLLVDHCPSCGVSLLPESDFCDHCGRPLSARATLGRFSSGDEVADPARYGAPASLEETPPLETGSPASADRQTAQRKAPRLDRYIPEELRDKLDAARSKGEMVGERRIVTMLFCDVKGSTAAAEKLDPEEWTEIINGAFENMIKPVYKYEGTVARLMGDGILAFFGAPIAHEDDPQRAVLAGLDIVAGISAYRERVNREWGIDLNVRVGINTGLVVVGNVGSDLSMEYTAMGDAINLAARMEQTAEPGTVQIAYDTYRTVKALFEVEALGEIVVKGKADPLPAFRVLGRKTWAGRHRGTEGSSVALVGRDRDLATLQEIFASARQGVGHIVSVIGEAGLGKSRLIGEAKRTPAGQALGWLETASLSYENNQPYAPFQRLIRLLCNMSPADPAEQVREKLARLGCEFDDSDGQRARRVLETLFDLPGGAAKSGGGDRLEGEAFKRELYEMMPAFWRQRFSKQPTVLVFDDMHWSDPASIELLLHLFPLTAEIPVVLICSFRPERGEPVWQIKTTGDEDFRPQYTEVTVRPLSDKQVNELIDELLFQAEIPPGVRARILESAAGNPFFVEEVVRSLIDNQALMAEVTGPYGQKKRTWRANDDGRQIDIPENLHALLSARIDRLEEQTRQLLQTAAVIGRSFYRRVLEAIEAPGQGSAWEIDRRLDALLQSKMIRETARLPELEYRFSNPLTQEVAYQTILLKRRRELHRRVGQALEALFPDQLGELAPQLAHHFAEANVREKAFAYYLAAGDSAGRLFAHIEALDHYTRAMSFVESMDPGHDDLEALFLRRGRVLELLSRYEDSLENYNAMLQLARDRADKRLELAAKMAQATIHSIPSRVYDSEISLELSEEARILAHEIGDSSAEAKIHWNLMLHHMWAGFNFKQAAIHGEAAVRIARDSGLPIELGPILNDLALVYFGVGRLNDSLEAFEESRDLLREGKNLPLLALNLTNSATVQFVIGNSNSARALIEEAQEINLAIENAWGLAGVYYYMGTMQLIDGDWGEALAALSKSIDYCQKAQAEMLLAVGYVAKANYYVLVGATETGLDFCGRGAKLFETHLPDLLGHPWAIMSLLYLLDGDQSSARQALQDSLVSADLDLPPTPAFVSIEIRLAEIKFRLAEGRPELAAGATDDLLEHLSRFHVRQFRGEALMLKAKALLALDRPEEASGNLKLACREAEELATRPVLWQVLDLQAQALERLGHPDLAASKRERARATVMAQAGSIFEERDRATFLDLADVRRLLDDQG